MNRRVTTDAGSRYRCRLPFAREVPADERETLQTALETAVFDTRAQYDTEPIDTHSVDVTPEAATVTVGLALDGDREPAEVLGRLYQVIGEWHNREAPLGEPTRAGGEQSISSVDAAVFATDRDPDGEGLHTYTLAYPDRPLTAEECDIVDHATGEECLVEPSYLALVDVAPVIGTNSAGRALQRFRESLAHPVPRDHDLRTPRFFGTREVGTLATGPADGTTREMLRRRGRQQSPHPANADGAEDVDAAATADAEP